MKREDRGALIAMLIVVGLFAGVAWLVHYKFTDCKKVGHSTLYCILDASR